MKGALAGGWKVEMVAKNKEQRTKNKEQRAKTVKTASCHLYKRKLNVVVIGDGDYC